MKRTITPFALAFSTVTVFLTGCGKDSNPAAPTQQPTTNAAAGVPSKTPVASDQENNRSQPNGRPAKASTDVAHNIQAGDYKPPTSDPKGTQADLTADSAPTTGGKSHRDLTVPDGPPEAIMAFVQQLEEIEPQGDTEEDFWADFRNIQDARIAGCDKILAGDTADEPIRFSAVLTKIHALETLIEMEQADAHDRLVKFCNSLLDDDNPDIAREGRLRGFEFKVNDFVTAAGSFDPLAKGLDEILKDKSSYPRLVEVGHVAANSLYAAGHEKEAAQVMKTIGEALDDDSELAEAAASMLDQAMMIELNFPAKMEAALEGKDGAADELIATLETLVDTGEPSATDLQTAATVGRYLEIAGNYDAAARTYRLIQKKFEDHANAEMAEEAAWQAAHGLKRTGLVGQRFEVTGVTHDGQPFDWSDYEGKAVLVDFWATWCGPCLEELPNVEKNYHAFHDKGFEVVGVNLDDDSAAVDQFLAERQLPWTTVVSADPAERGFNNPLVERCGIDSIPFLVLVGRDGKVAALHVRGPELENRLTALLNPSAE